MKKKSWAVVLGGALVLASLGIYVVHFLIFRDSHHVFIYLLGDLAFLPIEVLLVTVIIHRLLEGRAKRIMLEKLNMVIGTFLGEVGYELLRDLTGFDRNFEPMRGKLVVGKE